MRKWKLALAISVALSGTISSASYAADDSWQLHGYGMAAGDFESEVDRPKNMSLHMDPTGPNQDPRGKMGDLGNTYWHDYFTSLAVTKKWDNVLKDGQWADFTYQVVGYGNKSLETGQNFIRFGGLDFLPEESSIWAGRRYFSERVSVFAYNIEDVMIDSGIGYTGKNLDITVGTAQEDWGDGVAHEGSRGIFDLAYRVGQAEFGVTYVNELDERFGFIDPAKSTPRQQAVSVSAKYRLKSFLGMTDGSTLLEAQFGKGVIAQYLNTSRISVLSEEDDKAMRLTMSGSVDSVEGFTIKPAVIFEYTDRDDTVSRVTSVQDKAPMATGSYNYGSADETGLFAGVTVQQKLTDNLSWVYEGNINNTRNKDGVEDADGTAYKFAMGPAVQLDVQPWVAPIASLTVAYVGGDEEITGLGVDSEVRFGYRMEVWF